MYYIMPYLYSLANKTVRKTKRNWVLILRRDLHEINMKGLDYLKYELQTLSSLRLGVSPGVYKVHFLSEQPIVSMDDHPEDLKKILSSHLPIHTFCLILSELPLVDHVLQYMNPSYPVIRIHSDCRFKTFPTT